MSGGNIAIQPGEAPRGFFRDERGEIDGWKVVTTAVLTIAAVGALLGALALGIDCVIGKYWAIGTIVGGVVVAGVAGKILHHLHPVEIRKILHRLHEEDDSPQAQIIPVDVSPEVISSLTKAGVWTQSVEERILRINNVPEVRKRIIRVLNNYTSLLVDDTVNGCTFDCCGKAFLVIHNRTSDKTDLWKSLSYTEAFSENVACGTEITEIFYAILEHWVSKDWIVLLYKKSLHAKTYQKSNAYKKLANTINPLLNKAHTI